jgi:ribosome-associated protein
MSRKATRITPLSKKPAKAKKAAKKAKKSPAKKAKKAAPAKTARKAAAKKSPARKTAKKAVKKVAKKVAKKAIKKAVAKSAVKKAPARKVAAKKAAPRKVAPKKVAPRKVAAKKLAPRKAAAKKAAPRKAPATAPLKLVTPAPIKVPYEGASAELVNSILNVLEDAKAENTVAIDLEGRSTMADAMVVTTGRVNRHVAAIADQLLSKLKDRGTKNIRVEGLEAGDWCLVDTGDVIIHIFRPEVRVFYNLEKLWSIDAPKEHH